MNFSPEIRPTKLYVNLSSISHNVREIRKAIGPGTGIMAVIKASGYGCGSENIVKTLLDSGIERFAVAIPAEAITLRNAGLNKPILILSPLLEADLPDIVEYSLIASISDIETAQKLDALSKEKNKKVKIHVEIDTGMGRTGVQPLEALALIKAISLLKNIEIEGIFTHFASSEDDYDFTKKQIAAFDSIFNQIRSFGINIPIRHTCNGGGIIFHPEAHYEFVRPGLMLYGYYSDESMKERINLIPALELKTQIAHIKEVSPGTSISYNQTYKTKRPSVIATLPIGYADGYRRELSNKGFVLVNKCKAPIVGRVCMDLLMIDVTGINGIKKGDEVTLFDQKNITAEEIAKLCGTIIHEIISTISPRIPRIYIKE